LFPQPIEAGRPPAESALLPRAPQRQLTDADEALFKQLVKVHQVRLYRFVVKHIGWSCDAEDLTQQAFVEAAQSVDSF